MIDKLNSRSNTFSLVLNDSGADVFKSAHNIKEKIVCDDKMCVPYVAVIKHDNDIDDVGNVKTVHYHVVIQFDSVCRLRTCIDYFVRLFNCNPNQVSCEKCTSMVMQTRYLIHLDDFDKYQYDMWDIETNNIDFVSKSMKYVKNIISIDDLIVLVKQYKNLLELMSVIGYENYKRYRVIITDIRRELKYTL